MVKCIQCGVRFSCKWRVGCLPGYHTELTQLMLKQINLFKREMFYFYNTKKSWCDGVWNSSHVKVSSPRNVNLHRGGLTKFLFFLLLFFFVLSSFTLWNTFFSFDVLARVGFQRFMAVYVLMCYYTWFILIWALSSFWKFSVWRVLLPFFRACVPQL